MNPISSEVSSPVYNTTTTLLSKLSSLESAAQDQETSIGISGSSCCNKNNSAGTTLKKKKKNRNHHQHQHHHQHQQHQHHQQQQQQLEPISEKNYCTTVMKGPIGNDDLILKGPAACPESPRKPFTVVTTNTKLSNSATEEPQRSHSFYSNAGDTTTTRDLTMEDGSAASFNSSIDGDALMGFLSEEEELAANNVCLTRRQRRLLRQRQEGTENEMARGGPPTQTNPSPTDDSDTSSVEMLVDNLATITITSNQSEKRNRHASLRFAEEPTVHRIKSCRDMSRREIGKTWYSTDELANHILSYKQLRKLHKRCTKRNCCRGLEMQFIDMKDYYRSVEASSKNMDDLLEEWTTSHDDGDGDGQEDVSYVNQTSRQSSSYMYSKQFSDRNFDGSLSLSFCSSTYCPSINDVVGSSSSSYEDGSNTITDHDDSTSTVVSTSNYTRKCQMNAHIIALLDELYVMRHVYDRPCSESSIDALHDAQFEPLRCCSCYTKKLSKKKRRSKANGLISKMLRMLQSE